MPSWTAPFHAPRFAAEEFKKKKADYNAKYGYNIDVPGFNDVVLLGQPDPMTEAEEKSWKAKKYGELSDKRYDEIKGMKQKRKEAFLRMMASPSTPEAMNIGSVLTSLDDAQDAVATLVCLGKIAVKVLPAAAKKIISGPVGWMMLASDCLNLLTYLSRAPLAPKAAKRALAETTANNPFGKMARAKRAQRIKKWRPTVGNIIEGLQVTGQLFGVGISLGPIVGFAQDVLAGSIRTLAGQKVTFEGLPMTINPAEAFAMSFIKSNASHHMVEQHTDDDDEARRYLMSNLAQQILAPLIQETEPLGLLYYPDRYEVRAPVPTNILTLEVFAEEGVDPLKHVGWPQINKEWARYKDIEGIVVPGATKNLTTFSERNRKNMTGFIAGTNASDASIQSISNIEGEDQMRYDYSLASKVGHKVFDAGYIVNPDNTPEQQQGFVDYIEYLDSQGQTITFEELNATIEPWAGKDFFIRNPIP